MKIKITLLVLVALLCTTKMSHAQLESIGSSDYGRIFNITYDPNIQDKLYATSLFNHILVSHNNGVDWEVLFSMSVHDVTTFKDLKMTNNNTALSFIKFKQSSPDNTIIIFDLATNSVIDEIEIPYSSPDRFIKSYSIYSGNSDVILMNTKLDYSTAEHTYYTQDGGENWNLVYSKSDNDEVAINSVAISPYNPNHLFLGRGLGPSGVDGGLFMSTDGGQTWVDKLPGIVVAPIAFNPNDPNDILLGTGISFGSVAENLYRSSDAGDTWEIVPMSWTNEQLDDITVIGFNPNVPNQIIVLEENEIVISNDNGTTWQNHIHDSDNVHGYYYGTHLSFNPFNNNEVFINSDYHPQFSSDGGVTLTWSKNNYYLSTGSLGLFPNGNEHLYYGVQYGFVHKDLTTNVEEDFDILPINWYNQSDAPTLYVDAFVEGRVFTFSGGWFGSNLNISEDHGQTKHQILNTYMNYFDAVATDSFDQNTIWVSFSNTSGYSELYSVDVNDFDAMETTNIPLPNNGVVRGIHFDPQNQGHVVITVGTRVYKTEDYGATWTLSSGLEQLNPGLDLILHIDNNPLNPQQLAIASNKGIFTSVDGGSTWSQIYTELVHQIFFSDVTDGYMVGTVHTSGVSDYAIVYTVNGGQNWTRIENDALMSIGSNNSQVKFNTSNEADIYIASIDLGLVKYTLDLQALSIDESEYSEDFISVFPNPAKDSVTITSSKETIESLALYDLTGKMIHKSFGKNQVDVSALPKGVYLLTIEVHSGQLFSKKIVKM
ncbi:T9SS type A sorting domain-containing protein [Psychroserpens sp. SPM9]|uniref:T9SS type A sorting domain-containing protein n=1 Tax=Psychroserpens sp. SPM9 TaxID=2975598 RepID=UPI0021A260BE|nr:T9SS type A sorting domain-containing protein [Psychroserpens sp. SPM9]MDG5491293.1 T9SS type A sorting domain-containing protein [Psychroserpens sp. SPM9]